MSYRWGKRRNNPAIIPQIIHDTVQIPVHDTIIKWHEKIRYREVKPETVYIDTSYPIPPDSIKKGILYLKMTPKSLHIKGFVKGSNGFIPFSLLIIQTQSLMPTRAFMIREQRKWVNIEINSGAVLYPLQWSRIFLETRISRGNFYLTGKIELTTQYYRWGVGVGYRLLKY